MGSSRTNQTASVLNAFGSATNANVASGTNSLRYVWNRDLQIGSPYFADVQALQTALAKEGSYAGEATGGFYNQTFAAVQAFQQKYGIEATGFVGSATRAKLNSLYSK
jgi:murein L,D-transpeptidase YcbB/YkuD